MRLNLLHENYDGRIIKILKAFFSGLAHRNFKNLPLELEVFHRNNPDFPKFSNLEELVAHFNLKQTGEVGETVKYNPLYHNSANRKLLPGDQGIIIMAGYDLVYDTEEIECKKCDGNGKVDDGYEVRNGTKYGKLVNCQDCNGTGISSFNTPRRSVILPTIK
jgi:hypothetical protein